MLNGCQKKTNETFKKLDAVPVNNVFPITATLINYNNFRA